MSMKKEEFIKTATSKIYNFNQKQKIKAELTDHIETKESFFMKIGYSKEASEEKALSAMGDAEEISADLSKLYNSFYNPLPDIIAFSIWFISLGILYLFFSKYVFYDVGAGALCAAGIAFSTSILFLFSAFAVIKKRKTLAIGNIIGSFINAAFNIFCFASIDKISDGSISYFNSILFKHTIPKTISKNFTINPLIFTILILTASIAIQVILFAYLNKTDTAQNTLNTNKSLKILKNTSLISAGIIFIFSLLLITEFFLFQTNIKKEYTKTFDLAMEISQSCETRQDILNYINQNSNNFEEIKLGDEIIGYNYNGSIGKISINFLSEKDFENSEQNILKKLTSVFIEAVYEKYPESKEQKYDYTLDLNIANPANYKNEGDSISLKKLKAKEETLDIFYNFETAEHSNDEIIKFLKEHCPTSLTIHPSKNKERFNTEITAAYTCGNGEYKYNTDFNIILKSKSIQTADKQKENIIKILNENPDINDDELAAMLNAKIITPDFSYSEFMRNVSNFKSSMNFETDEEKETKEEILSKIDSYAESLYNYFTCFEISDDLNFKKINSSDKSCALIFFDSKTNIEYLDFNIVGNNTEEKNYNAMYLGNFRKIYIKNKGYCSMKGYAYNEYKNIPYYTKDGSRYRFVTEADENGNELYYLVNIHGDKHEAYDCYTDKNGYLVFDDKNEFKKTFNNSDLKITEYQDKNKNKYIKALETNWDTDGSLLDYNEYYN